MIFHLIDKQISRGALKKKVKPKSLTLSKLPPVPVNWSSSYIQDKFLKVKLQANGKLAVPPLKCCVIFSLNLHRTWASKCGWTEKNTVRIANSAFGFKDWNWKIIPSVFILESKSSDIPRVHCGLFAYMCVFTWVKHEIQTKQRSIHQIIPPQNHKRSKIP